MAERLIDAEALKERIEDNCCDNCGGVLCSCCKVDDVFCVIEDAPTIEAKPVVHAHWISASWEEDEENGIENTYSDEFICSNCKEHLIFYDAIEKEDIAGNYCPYCGAQMDEKESD